jgi:hypothetical protein
VDGLEHLLSIAKTDTGGGHRCAMFLLSLWNGYEFPADMQELLYVDDAIFGEMIEVLRYLHANNLQLDSLVSQSEIDPILAMWGDVLRQPEQ